MIEINSTIILAAGHGGGDPGATGQGTTEETECIQIVNRLADKLRADGRFTVAVVPHELNLIDEINWVNARYKNLADGLCIEVHKNATVNGHGVEVWFYSGDAQSQAIASDVLEGIMTVPNMPPSRGVKGDATNRWGSLGWIRETNPWSILVEMGFVSDGGDPVDDAADDRYAQGLYAGILNFYGWPTPGNATPAPSQANTQTPVQPKYRVYGPDGSQIGAYNTEDAAWNKYASGGTKIVEVATATDVTQAFVAEYRPAPAPVPAPTPAPTQPAPTFNYKIISPTGVVSNYQDLGNTWLGYVNAGRVGRIYFAADNTDITDQMVHQYDPAPVVTPVPTPTQPAAPAFNWSFRLPHIDSATYKAVITSLQTALPVLIAWLVDPHLVAFVTTYVPWLLPVITFGAGAAAFLLNAIFRSKTVKPY